MFIQQNLNAGGSPIIYLLLEQCSFLFEIYRQRAEDFIGIIIEINTLYSIVIYSTLYSIKSI